MKMKAVAFHLSLCLMLSVFAGAYAAPGDAVLFPSAADGMNDNAIQSMAAVGDTLYLLSYNGLYAWQASAAEPRLLSKDIKMGYASGKWEDMPIEEQEKNKNSVNCLFEMNGELYGLNTVKGALLLLTVAADGVSISEEALLDWDSMFIQEADFSYTRHIYSAVLAADRLYLLVQQPNDNWSDYDLLAYDITTGAQTKMAVENVHAITRYENGQLLCNVYDSENQYTRDGKTNPPTLSVLDPAAQSLTKLADFPAQAGGLCYSTENGMVYALGRGELYGLKPGNAFETVAYMPCDYPNDQMPAAMLSGGLYAAIPNYGAVYVRNIDPALKANRVLCIAGGNSDNVTKAFQAAHPELPVIFVDAPFRGAEQIAQQMVSGSDIADLFIINLSYGGFTSLRDKGYVTDLSGSAVLTEAVAKMYPQYVKEVFKDGKLIAFPCRFNANIFGYSPDIMKELGIGKPPQTLFELMDLYVDWVEEYSQAYPGYTLMESIYDIRSELLSTIVMNYIALYARSGEDLKFDTPLFKSLLAKLDEVSPILEELNPSQEEQSGGMVVYSSNGFEDKPTSLLSNFYTFYPNEYSNNKRYMPLPLSLDEGLDPALFSYIEVFVINPNSQNVDLAQTYIEFFAQNMPRHFSVTFCPDDNMPVEDTNNVREIESISKSMDNLKTQIQTAGPEERKSLEEMLKSQAGYLAYLEKNRFSVTEEKIKQYRSLVPFVCIDTQNIEFLTGSQESLTLFQRFMQGEMETEQFVREFDRKLQMMRMENY